MLDFQLQTNNSLCCKESQLQNFNLSATDSETKKTNEILVCVCSTNTLNAWTYRRDPRAWGGIPLLQSA